jgi:DNA repair protein RAD57
VHILLNVLENQVPSFIETIAKTPSRKPVKLLIIDALTELFHLVEKTSTASLVARSQQLTQISALLHRLASRYNIAIVVLNEVADVFDNYAVDSEKSDSGLLSYSEQARWFSRGHSVYGENKKEASLGLVWANQVNTRVMLSRTGRRRYVEEETNAEEGGKRRKTEERGEGGSRSNQAPEPEPSLIRRLTVIFNSAGSPTSCDYIVTPAGVKGLQSEERPPQIRAQPQPASPLPQSSDTVPGPSSQPQLQAPAISSQTVIPSSQEHEEYDHLWVDEEFYDNVDWDSLELTLLKSQEAVNRLSDL